MADIRNLCVYCGASTRAPELHLAMAYQLGHLIGQAGVRLIYGGGGIGLMGRVADGAIDAGGKVTGIIPGRLNRREVAHPALDELVVVETMHDRKRLMGERADGFAILPGGFGTLEEMFEIVTWRQLGLHEKPVVLVDFENYWQPLLAMIDRFFTTGYAGAESHHLFSRVERVEDVLPSLADAPTPIRPLDATGV